MLQRYSSLLITGIFICSFACAQPVILIHNGSVSGCEMFIVDSDSMRGNWATGITTLTVISSNNSKLALNLELLQTRTDNDNIAVFDGPTTSSTLITTMYKNSLFNGNPYYAVSTGNSLTIRINAFPSVGVGKFRIKVRCVSDPDGISIFQPVMGGFGDGNIQLADYDKDGDKDMLVGGKVFRNDTYTDSFYLTERKTGALDGWTNTEFATADFDNDGDKDIFITGTSVIPGFGAVRAALYSNDGTGQFTRVTSQVFENAYSGACSIVDFNGDGRPDICYTGRPTPSGTLNPIFKIYLNNGSLAFSDAAVSLPGNPGMINGTMSWADSDGDGDPDLVVQGYNGTVVSRLYIKNGNSLSAQSAPLTNTTRGRIVWTDVNKDGRPDIVNSGVLTNGQIDAIIPEILFNNGNNNFTRIVTNLPAWPSGTHDWSDYDNDNDNDVIICGLNTTTLLANTAVYRNNGNGNFTKVEVDGAQGISTVRWTDFNHDGKSDLFITGKDPGFSYFVKNMGNDLFKKSSFPITNYEPKGSVLVDDFTGDGLIDLLFSGDIEDLDCFGDYNSLLVKGLDWRFTGVPKFTEVVNLTTNIPNLSVIGATSSNFNFYWKWGDYDSDGNLDILLTFDPNGDAAGFKPFLIIYRNTGNNVFPSVYNSYVTPFPLTSALPYQVAIFDIDNDGKNEILLPLNNVFKWINNSWVLLYGSFGTCSFNCNGYYFDLADYDKDGYMDAAVGTPESGVTNIYRNDRAGKLVFVQSFGQGDNRQLKWFDLDKDGDLDLLVSGLVIENRNGEFTAITSGIMPFIHTAIGDFNQDGWPDLLNIDNASMQAGDKPGDFYLSMQGTMFFKKVTASKMLVHYVVPWEESVESFDVDNDGDDDIVHTANHTCSRTSVLFANMANVIRRNIHVRTPNGGETFAPGSTQTIQWMGSQIGATVKIELSRDSMQTWEIISNVAGSTVTGGNFLWAVTGPQAQNCFIRITDNSNNAILDLSNSAFRITTATAINSPQTVHTFQVFPNPANESLHLRSATNTSLIGESAIYNIHGVELGRTTLRIMPGQTMEINIRKLVPGIYFLKIKTAKKVETIKFVKS